MQVVSLDKIGSKQIFFDINGLAQRWNFKESWSFIGNPRKNHGFMLILGDEVRMRYKNGEDETFYKGNLLYIPKGSEYYVEFWNTSGGYADLLVNFHIRDFHGNEYCLADRITCILTDAIAEFSEDFTKICSFHTNIKNPYLQITKVFFGILEKINANRMMSEGGSKAARVMAPALFYVDSHIGDNITVPELAKMCLLSESAFRKAFREYTGMSPSQYKIKAKIEKACEFLSGSPEITIAEVSEQLGFYDISYFYKTFLAITGITPYQYRNGK